MFAYKNIIGTTKKRTNKTQKQTNEVPLGGGNGQSWMVSPLTINRAVFPQKAYLLIGNEERTVFLINKYETTLGKRNTREKPDINLVPFTLRPWSISNLHAIIRFTPANEQYTLIVKSKNSIMINNEHYSYGAEAVLGNKYTIMIKDIKITFLIKNN